MSGPAQRTEHSQSHDQAQGRVCAQPSTPSKQLREQAANAENAEDNVRVEPFEFAVHCSGVDEQEPQRSA